MRRDSPSSIRVSLAHRTAPWMLVLLPLLATRGRADIIVGPNDDLVAIVAAAADGETLILESNGTYVGTLTWFERSLTLRAGDGFTPTVRGSDDGPALIFSASSTAPTVGRFVGIDFEAGTETGPTAVEVSLLATGTGDAVGELIATNSTFTSIIAAGTGAFRSGGRLVGCSAGSPPCPS